MRKMEHGMCVLEESIDTSEQLGPTVRERERETVIERRKEGEKNLQRNQIWYNGVGEHSGSGLLQLPYFLNLVSRSHPRFLLLLFEVFFREKGGGQGDSYRERDANSVTWKAWEQEHRCVCVTL